MPTTTIAIMAFISVIIGGISGYKGFKLQTAEVEAWNNGDGID